MIYSAKEARRLTNDVKDANVESAIHKAIGSGYLFATVNNSNLRPEFKALLVNEGYKFTKYDDNNTTIEWK